jgi:F0F1-type ATP synthase membrane subunit b/b'
MKIARLVTLAIFLAVLIIQQFTISNLRARLTTAYKNTERALDAVDSLNDSFLKMKRANEKNHIAAESCVQALSRVAR